MENSIAFVNETARQMGLLFKFVRQMNELDFAGSLSGEFRGAQDAGWSTTITADQVYEELRGRLAAGPIESFADMRIILLLYSQLSEAGGVYESLKNMMGIVESAPYNLWPFRDLVRVKQNPKRVIGPNANATFRALATHARKIGMIGLSSALENVFRDDVRNGMYHSDYILWNDGLRLRRRNGGHVTRIEYTEVLDLVGIGLAFFETLQMLRKSAMQSFDPPREIIGRFSANPPMPHTVAYNTETGSFSISCSSPGAVTSPEYLVQEAINKYLGGRVMVVFRVGGGAETPNIDFLEHGFEPSEIDLEQGQLVELLKDIDARGLWDGRESESKSEGLLTLSPWGFRHLENSGALKTLVGEPELIMEFVPPAKTKK
ncbi:hypothetical protein [Phaeovulum vinaykumarii]|uniref:Uncharacterized protein n=1 Tax=Phaeovulum vinaykumarii TaxID=407234 RepID=A0A1N7JP43_9RHOB|nr:hypothetical protein [Phaeovulum vinaykumarii]SIS51014.1 hypothetical protein SAMN05421795_101203 [Phaeovulum vinaykumarii]SOB90539.1 hypothetical protein SAMN05878426_101203 [Phaeovulum vinaykumarii]